jgi:EAL domain-containing protein (putative c-di-GMP-specific phosphodiesterase class I)
MRMKGFKLSIDDFGTGFATFEQLERIPFTELKIDRSITQELPGSHRHEVMARHILGMARDLELTTVAEGIETIECWKSLKAMGCVMAQGYLIARPMPGDQIPDWSRRDRSMYREKL